MKVELDVNHKIDSVDLVDQLVKARLQHIANSLDSWNESPDVVNACEVLLDWMKVPVGE
jgi:hypothetical protein